MQKIQLDVVRLFEHDTLSKSFALLLQEIDGNRRLPIMIGQFEAQAIAISIEHMTPPRPLTHDLFKNFAEAVGYTVTEIVITDLKEGVFYSTLNITDGKTETELDARTSDAIALAIRFECPIYIYDHILDAAGVTLEEMKTADEPEDEKAVRTPSATPRKEKKETDVGKLGLEELNKRMNAAIAEENYELAARLRDEITKRQGNSAANS